MSEVLSTEFNELSVPLQPETPAEKWRRENQKGIEAINKYAEEYGSFSDYQRAF
ncbi:MULTISPECIES: type II toxin-antitoxin system CcdA family antitoxin [unclassified Rahnella]|uniref:type II toxin-antitoxin system CcdA family antitoxin n=1 Tax=unclassified Rahnella TaxID=2635087 RepID=UPI00160826E1|nr:antitoxin CcdA [Rahnella inusitata]